MSRGAVYAIRNRWLRGLASWAIIIPAMALYVIVTLLRATWLAAERFAEVLAQDTADGARAVYGSRKALFFQPTKPEQEKEQ